ncbi:54S ribosomal protein L20, mitochondrial [Madurella fahalii]|uniref:54S ribosomal protein L20, mitochondrial n=1 Tax=Madurella fahalii TaxID=1157608 RepID=A0ABQ0GBK9_9PEZI
MEAIVTRPTAALSCCCRVLPWGPPASRLAFLRSSKTTLPSGTRQKSSSARTRRALRIPPHPSFLSSNLDARPAGDHIIFNPPASAPSVYHTPFKFLPKSDPRRRANLASALFASSTTVQYNDSSNSSSSHNDSGEPTAATAPPSPEDLPVVNELDLRPTNHSVTKEDIEQMRALRLADPVANSVQTLAERFGCSKLFVMMCCQSPREHRDQVKAQEEAVKERWGPRRAAAREERRRRWEMVLNGEL